MKFWFVLLSTLSLSAISVAYLATAGLPYEPLATKTFPFSSPYYSYPPPVSIVLEGSAALQGRKDGDNAGIKVTLRTPSGGFVDEHMTDEAGRYVLFAEAFGVYRLELRRDGWLPENLVVVVDEEFEVLPAVTLKSGDADSDGDVDTDDLKVFRQNLGAAPSPRHVTDVNNDGRVDAVDLGHAALNWGLPYDVSLAVCPGSRSGDPAAPQILDAHWAMRADNSLIFDLSVSTDSDAQVWAEFRRADGKGEWLRTRLTPEGMAHQLELMRLRANTNYCLQIVAQEPDAADSKESASWAGVFRTGALPNGLANTLITLESGQPTYPLTLLEHNTATFHGILAVDANSDIVWYYNELDNRNVGAIAQDEATSRLYYAVSGFTGGATRNLIVREITPGGSLLAQSPNLCVTVGDNVSNGAHHEVIAPRGGEVYYLGRTIENPFGNPARLQQGDTIRKWNPATGEDTLVWNAFNHLDPSNDRTATSNEGAVRFWAGCNGEVMSEDWTHANSLQFAPDGNLIMSIRHLNEIIAINPTSGELEWRLGSANRLGSDTSDFAFPNPDDRFYHQHSARQLPNGNILLFDNGNGRPAAERGEYSRALELSLDWDTMTATKVWEYKHTPAIFSACCSNVTRLENGNSLLVFGSNNNPFTVVEADPSGNAVAVMRIAAPKSVQYRVYPISSINGETAR